MSVFTVISSRPGVLKGFSYKEPLLRIKGSQRRKVGVYGLPILGKMAHKKTL